jgi:hypothetical protein
VGNIHPKIGQVVNLCNDEHKQAESFLVGSEMII